ncbi:unnamed protein product [Mytilus edulis]|uniref:Reverse transcriptase n=1 Tax=Mytilus edulis TaxID=6550 RepID=A0A8S3SCX5_MYTED|nr:unnamed protein product [Mytilus edulis]
MNESNGTSFVHLQVSFDDMNVAALVDTGSSINVISQTLYNTLSHKSKLSFEQFPSEIRLADNTKVKVFGLAKILLICNNEQHAIEVYILPFTSHPLILGTNYLHSNNIILDFSNFSANFKSVKVQTHKKLTIPPNSECIVWGHVPTYVLPGLNGVCSNHKFILEKGLMVAKSLVTVSYNHKVPVKVLNATALSVVIPKDRTIAEFLSLNSDYSYVPIDQSCPVVQNIDIVNSCVTPDLNDCSESCSSNEHIEKVKDQFTLSDHLSESQQTELASLLYKNIDLFVTDDNPNLGYTKLIEHTIHLKPDASGKHQKPYRLPPYKREILRHHLDKLLKQGIISPVSETEDLPITSPIVLVTKRSKSSDQHAPQNFRFCCDFRYLNSQTQEFKYTIPNLQELTESFSEMTPNYITSIDLSSGFFQMGITPESSRYTAFNTCFGTYKFLRLPMGLKTSPNTFQLLMDRVLHGLKFKSCLCYLDDVLICSETFDQHMSDLSEVLGRFRNAGLKLGPKKCSFAAQSCVFLGHLISKDGILPPADRVQAIQEYPAPRNVKELRRLIGLFNWFKKFIPNFSATISSLTRLLQKNQTFKWGKEQDTAFNDLKYRLVNSEMLSFPQFNMQFRLSVDTSSRGIGYMLYQLDPEDKTCKPRIIRFGSKNLSRWQQSYGPTKLELLGMVVSILDCSDYLRGNQFIVECDHQALKPLYQKQFKGAIYERWLSILQQFNFEIVYKKAEQMEVPDALSRCENHHAEVVESPVEDDPYFPFVPDKIGHITLPNGQNFANLFQNNLEAVQAIHVSTEEHKSEHYDPYDADTDEPQYGNKQYKKKRQRILQESSKSDTDIVVDKMVNDKILAKISMPINNIKELQRQDTSLSPIINYLENDILPDLQKEARCVLLKSNDYALIDDILFHSRVAKSKRNKMMSHYQIVIPQALIPSVLKVVHDSPLGGHAGMNNTLDRAKEHFFFPRMGKIITDYVQTCHFCQVRKVTNFKTKQAIVAFPTPSEPFEVWQIDLCGPFPKSVNGNTYAFTAVDMFSKFIFAHPLRNNDALTVCEVIYRMFTQFGVCKTLVSDRGSEFVNQCTAGLCKLLEVTQEFTPAFAHHCLGACERQHRTLNERLTAHVLKDKLWETEINSVTFSMNSSVNSSIDFSPFEIVFGKRPKFPVFGAHFNLNDFHPNMQNYFSELTDRLKTVWEMVVKNAQYSGEKMEENANIKLNELKVSIGDYVYLQRTLTGQGRKFQPLYDGPFVVNSIPSPHLIKLRDPSGKRKLKSPVHINRVKLAHIRAPDPQNYLVQVPQQNPVSTSSDSNSESSEHEIPTEQDIQLQNDNPTPLRRTSRVVQKPIRYRDENFLSELSSCDGAQEKIKRILAKKPHGSSFLYLVQLIGEPAQNAKWKPLSELPPKAQELIIARPPPLV